MLLAGAIDIPTELILAFLAGLLIAAILVVSTGGLLAWSISGRRRSAFRLGSLAFLGVAVLTAGSLDLEWAVGAGYAASAVTGGLHRRVARRRSPAPPSLSPD